MLISTNFENFHLIINTRKKNKMFWLLKKNTQLWSIFKLVIWLTCTKRKLFLFSYLLIEKKNIKYPNDKKKFPVQLNRTRHRSRIIVKRENKINNLSRTQIYEMSQPLLIYMQLRQILCILQQKKIPPERLSDYPYNS